MANYSWRIILWVEISENRIKLILKLEAFDCIFPGVMVEERGSETLQQLVSFVWDELSRAKSLNKVDIQFVQTEQRLDMTMDTLIEGIGHWHILV